MIDTKINLCDTCKYSIPECEAESIEFGNGTGNDNIIKCSGYKIKQNYEANFIYIVGVIIIALMIFWYLLGKV